MEDPKNQSTPGPESESRIVHYAYSYQMLPMLIFSRHNEALWDQFRDPVNRLPTLLDAWMRTCRHFDVKDYEPIGLEGSFIASEDKEYLVIKMPEPVKPPEAYYCVAQKSVSEGKFRYFSAEYGFVPEGGSRIVLGEWLAPMNRRNLGEIPAADVDEMLTAIAGLSIVTHS